MKMGLLMMGEFDNTHEYRGRTTGMGEGESVDCYCKARWLLIQDKSTHEWKSKTTI